MAIKVPIRFRVRGDQSDSGLEAERIFDVTNWYVLHSRTDNTLKIVIARALDSLELKVIEWIIMNSISNDQSGEYTVTRISEDFDMNIPQATVLVKSLTKRNLVRQKVSLKDRRVKFLACTRRGTKLVYDGEQVVQHAIRYWLFDLSDDEIVSYMETMKKINSFEIPGSFS